MICNIIQYLVLKNSQLSQIFFYNDFAGTGIPLDLHMAFGCFISLIDFNL